MVEKLNYLNKGLIGLFLIFLTLGLIAVSFSILRSAVKEGADRPSFRGGQERAYAVLDEIRVSPNVWYLRKVRNKKNS